MLKNTFASMAIVMSLGFAASVVGGCKATVTTGESTPPPPPPAPTPPPDKDGDGIADADDACPDQAGAKNDDPKLNGCPAPPPPAPVEAKVAIVGNDVTIKEKIMFDVGKASIKAESNALLDEIADVLKKDGAMIDLIEVGGHADKQGDEKQNLKLTDDRAKAVVEALVKLGVDAKRLRAKGYGQYCPVDTGSTPEAFEKNRRVEFKILKMNGKATGAVIGCDEAVKHGIKPAPVL